MLDIKFIRENPEVVKEAAESKNERCDIDAVLHLDKQKRETAIGDYEALFGSRNIDLNKVKERARYLSRSIRNVIAQVTIRRNRIDLRKDPEYSREIYELSEIGDPAVRHQFCTLRKYLWRVDA